MTPTPKLRFFERVETTYNAYRCGYEAGRLAEREACAKLCEAQGEYGDEQYAAAIRARSQA
jgi:hypothetical protein